MKQLGSGGWLTNPYVMRFMLLALLLLIFVSFSKSRAKHPKAEMLDDHLGSATVAHKLAPHQPRDRHTENVKKVIIVVIT